MTANTTAIAQGIQTILQATPSSLLTTCPTPIYANASPQTVTPLSMAGISVGVPYLMDVSNSEAVIPSAITSTTFTAIFTKDHAPNWTIGSGTPLYAATSVFLGGVQEPTDVIPCVSILYQQRQTERHTAGWRVHSKPTFLLETLAEYTNPRTAELFIMKAADVLTALFLSRITLPGASQVYVVYGDGAGSAAIPPDVAMYKAFPNGRVYRVHQLKVTATEQYNVQLQ